MTRASVPRALRRLGVELTRYPAPNTLPWHLKRVMQYRRIDGVVDVGAHRGEFAGLLRRLIKYQGPIESYEPSCSNFRALTEAMSADQRWQGHRLALGSERGTIELNVYQSSDFTSFLSPNASGLSRWDMQVADTEDVEVRRLDEITALTGDLLLKTDTQGYDLEVIAGASGILDRVAAVVIELAAEPIYEHAPHMTTALTSLRSLGYRLVGMVPLSYSADKLKVIEFDGVLVRD